MRGPYFVWASRMAKQTSLLSGLRRQRNVFTGVCSVWIGLPWAMRCPRVTLGPKGAYLHGCVEAHARAVWAEGGGVFSHRPGWSGWLLLRPVLSGVMVFSVCPHRVILCVF